VSRDARLYLIDMRDACTRIMHHRGEIPRELFFVDDLARDAVLWNLLVLGEAAKQVPENIRVANPTIEWRKIAGFRDVLAHGYFGLDEDILWDVIESKIPPLLEAVEQALTSLG
jgi:uncharacterized protein with HEPN domain